MEKRNELDAINLRLKCREYPGTCTKPEDRLLKDAVSLDQASSSVQMTLYMRVTDVACQRA